jgi:hypothetical protein
VPGRAGVRQTRQRLFALAAFAVMLGTGVCVQGPRQRFSLLPSVLALRYACGTRGGQCGGRGQGDGGTQLGAAQGAMIPAKAFGFAAARRIAAAKTADELRVIRETEIHCPSNAFFGHTKVVGWGWLCYTQRDFRCRPSDGAGLCFA